MAAHYSVGIDLGTTNTVVAYTSVAGVRVPKETPSISLLAIPQWVAPGQFESRESLPSFLYLPRPDELTIFQMAGWNDANSGVAGIFARNQAAENPQRVVAAAKSWLCLGRNARTDAVLPWQAPENVPKISARDCTQAFLAHLVSAWNHTHVESPLAQQHVVLTVPASFDPAARELTRQAAIAAGLPADFILLEEPQAAVYHWLASNKESWREQLQAGDLLLVVDVGGGTTDLTLVAVEAEQGSLMLKRVAVGNHLLLGGDNMDLTLAHVVGQRLQAQGHALDPWQNVALWHACRAAKERLLSVNAPAEQTISVLGRGSSLIASTLSTTVTRDEVQQTVLDGFFPKCERTDHPIQSRGSGFQDIGLPYESDPAITRHVAGFLAGQLNKHSLTSGSHGQPTHVLLNGGVFRCEALGKRLTDTVQDWFDAGLTILGDPKELDTAVATGAAYYGWSKQRGGVRIRGGTSRSFYIGVETAGLAIPGIPRPLRAVCIAPQGMEEGTETAVSDLEVGLVVGQPAVFRFFSSTQRPDDLVGTQLTQASLQELVENPPIEVELARDQSSDGPYVHVRFLTRVTELGVLELWCRATRGTNEWKLEFNTRQR